LAAVLNNFIFICWPFLITWLLIHYGEGTHRTLFYSTERSTNKNALVGWKNSNTSFH